MGFCAAINLAKLQAGVEEHNLRRDKSTYQREHMERFVEHGTAAKLSENEEKLNEANERRQLDARWELHESLRALQPLIELQHWRRQQRDRRPHETLCRISERDLNCCGQVN